MPSSEVKHRKGKITSTQDGDKNNSTKTSDRNECKKDGASLSEHNNVNNVRKASLWSTLDLKMIISLVCLSACFLLAGIVLQQNARFNEVEDKYRHLYEKAANLLELEEKLGAASKKLEVSEDHLKEALSSVMLVTRLEEDIASLNGVITAMQEEQDTSSRQLQKVNQHFLNVTEEWQGGLGAVTEELASLRAESRSIHARTTEGVNEAEGRLRALAERLEEVEDGTRRNARLLERTEEEDAQRVQNQLDWNTRQVTRLQEQLSQLFRKNIELKENLDETEPRAKECETHLPTVEDAVRSILRLGADLSSTERRLEELTLQVLGTEDSMLKALAEILELRQVLDNMQVDNTVMKVRNEVDVMLEAMKHLQIEQDLDNMQADNRVMKVQNEVDVMLEAMKHLQSEQDLDNMQVDNMQVDNTVMKVRNEVDVMLEAMKHLQNEQDLNNMQVNNMQVDNTVIRVRNEVDVMLEAMKHLQSEQDLDSGREHPQPDQGNDFDDINLDVENIKQLSSALKDLEKNSLMDSSLDHNDDQSTGAEEEPTTELNDLL